MQAKEYQIYVACHGDNEPRYSSLASLHRMKLNAYAFSAEEQLRLRNDGWLLDNTGRNISELNKWWAELTGIYWVVNNATNEFIGNAQYRRKWQDNALPPSLPSVLYIPDALPLPFSVRSQYQRGHVGMDGLEQALKAADRRQLPLSRKQLEQAFEQNIFYGHIMARGHHANYCLFMQTLIDCMWPIWEHAREQIMNIEGYNARYIAFLSERIMTALVLHRDKIWPGLEIQTAPMQFIGP
jgi:hypothetical protein